MTEAKDADKQDKEPGKKTLSLSDKGTLSLKGGTAGGGSRVRGVSQGRGAAASVVAVEVRRTRTTKLDQKSPGEDQDANLTSDERETRVRALRQSIEDGEKNRTSLPKRHTIEAKKREEQQKAEVEPTPEDIADIQAKLDTGDGKKPPVAAHRERFVGDEESESYRDKMKKAAVKAPVKRTPEDDRRGGRITVTQALNKDYERDRGMSLAAQRRAREKARMLAKASMDTTKIVRDVIVPETITVGELANRMAEPAGEVVKTLMRLGIMATITQSIDADTAELVVGEFGHKIKRVTEADVEIGLEGATDSEADLQPRPPVVTIMGHVDHGKTSLLDALRSTDVVAGEAGGITQHIGAYQVTMSSGDKITFLDTPGHEAFTEMRSRGAHVTDIVVIVVAADDSIMPQTIEAINHAKAAKVPIIIAINKIDLPTADTHKVKVALLQHEIVVEEMSGEVQCIEISAKKKINLDKLEEAILLQAEILELKVNPNRPAQGVVVEAKVEKGRGPVATVLIQKGTLRIGDIFVVGAESGKVRAIINDHGENIEFGVPGQPVEVLGIGGTPGSGDSFNVVSDEAKAREISAYRQRERRKAQAVQAVKGRTTIDQLVAQRASGKKTSLPVIIKADVHGSIEAIAGSLEKMVDENEGIAVQVLHSGVGGITESDVSLAKASGGVIIGFNVRANTQARDMAQREGVDIRYYNIIYNVIDDAKSILTGMLSPTEREEYLGQAEIRQVFNITKVGKVAGCMVTAGTVKRGAKVRLLRDNVVIHEGTLKTLKRFHDEVKDVREGNECGMAFETYDDIKERDIIECYQIVEEARTVT